MVRNNFTLTISKISKLFVVTLLFSTLLTTANAMDLTDTQEGNLLSHAKPSLCAPLTADELKSYHTRLRKGERDLAMPLDDEIQLLNALNEFELGRFLLRNRGLNGYWTAYLILYALEKELTHPLEKWLVHESPVVKATRERFHIFQRELQERVASDTVLATIPCGAMEDLFSLNYEGTSSVRLVGIDLDEKSIALAQENSRKVGNQVDVSLLKEDASSLSARGEYTLITSNGLNIYEKDNTRVTRLYASFHQTLQPNGTLIMSFLTPPPFWLDYNPGDVVKQKALFADIIGAKWLVFRSVEETREQLERVGFRVEKVIHDTQKMFPTVIATKL